MRKFSRRVLPVALVASMVGLVMAASSSTTTTTASAVLQPNEGLIVEDRPPTTCSGKLVYTKTTVVQNGTTFAPVTTVAFSMKGLLGKADYGKGSPVTFSVNSKFTPAVGSLENGTCKIFLDSSQYTIAPFVKADFNSGNPVSVTVSGVAGVLKGTMGVSTTTVK